MVSEFKLGNFPNVAGAKNAEWRVDRRGKAVGLIVRVSYQRPDIPANSPASQDSVSLFGLRGSQPVLLGTAQNNAEVRELMDKTLRWVPRKIGASLHRANQIQGSHALRRGTLAWDSLASSI